MMVCYRHRDYGIHTDVHYVGIVMVEELYTKLFARSMGVPDPLSVDLCYDEVQNK